MYIPALKGSRAQLSAAYNANRLDFLRQAARELGPVAQLWPQTIMVTGPREVHEVLRGTGRYFLSDRNLLLKKQHYLADPVMQEENRRIRRVATQAMTPSILADHSAWLANLTYTLADQLLREGKSPDITRELQCLTSLSITRFCF